MSRDISYLREALTRYLSTPKALAGELAKIFLNRYSAIKPAQAQERFWIDPTW
jgi:hypothetical protein